jgi:predicted chitinase
VTTTRDGSIVGSDKAELFTVDQLTEISQNLDPVANDLAGDQAALIPEMKNGGIITKNQITAFLANVCQETDHLNTLEEYGGEDYYRSFLGDQWMYHGRGYIMNTWLDAYQRLSDVLGVDLVSNPDLLAQGKGLAAKAAVWYWTTHDCGSYADQGDFEAVCSIINYGEPGHEGPTIHGWPERLAAYERAQSVIGIGTEPVTEPARDTSESVETEEEPKLLTAKPGTNFYKGLSYVKPLIGNMLYWVWVGGTVPDGEGMYAVDEQLPPSSQLIGYGINCAGATNLFFRAAGKRVPTRGNTDYDGGVAAYFYSDTINSQFGTKGYFEGYAKEFDLGTAKQWAEDTLSGVLIGRSYEGETLGGQGHVAILLPSGYVLQSFQYNWNGQPGLNWDYTIEESHQGGYYQWMVHPKDWIDYEDPEDDF